MAIQRNNTGSTEARFSVNLNVVLKGSKKMTPEQQEAGMDVTEVRVLIVDANDPSSVLVDEKCLAKEFNTGSVGYGLSLRDVQFSSS